MSWRPQPKGSRKPEKRRFQNKGLCFFAPFSGVPLSGKQCLCGHRWHKGGLLGLAPNPYLRANMARSVSVALLLIFITLTLLFLLSSRLGVAHQSVNVRLDRDDLLHIPSCLLVFSIELFFLCCELAAFLLQHIHFRELRPAQQRAHFRLCSPVQFKVGLMLRKEFPAVLRRLILLKDLDGFWHTEPLRPLARHWFSWPVPSA